ncbi:MAG: glycosyltransferase [Pseudomonadales bacterium]|nr:glycosyltransferase [Pseudomonadales bacterium]
MKILMLTPYLPYPLLSGGQIRTYNLLKKLANKHEVTLFALIKDYNETQYIPELEKYCAKVKVFKRSSAPFSLSNIFRTAISSFPFLVIRNHVPQVISAVKEELSQDQYDLIHAETFYMMPHIPETAIPTLLVEQTIEYLGYESYAKRAPKLLQGLLSIDIKKIKRWERHYWKQSKKLIVMSEEDKKFIGKELGSEDKIEVVANGVDTTWFEEKQRYLPDNPTLLSVGTFKWLPNVEAVTFLVQKIWPHVTKRVKNSKLWIVGNAPTKDVMDYQEKDPNITVSGTIPDIRDAFKGAHVLVAPVFSGKGTRYKILEAMASGTPIVATTTAVEGLDVKHGIHVLTSDTAKGMADLVVKLLKDPALQKKLAKNGKAFVKSKYDWSIISEKLDTIYQTIGSNHA